MEPVTELMARLAVSAKETLNDDQRALSGGWVGSLQAQVESCGLDAKSVAAGALMALQGISATMIGYLPLPTVRHILAGPSQAVAVACWQLEEFNEFLPCTEEEALLLIEQIMQKKSTDG